MGEYYLRNYKNFYIFFLVIAVLILGSCIIILITYLFRLYKTKDPSYQGYIPFTQDEKIKLGVWSAGSIIVISVMSHFLNKIRLDENERHRKYQEYLANRKK